MRKWYKLLKYIDAAFGVVFFLFAASIFIEQEPVSYVLASAMALIISVDSFKDCAKNRALDKKVDEYDQS